METFMKMIKLISFVLMAFFAVSFTQVKAERNQDKENAPAAMKALNEASVQFIADNPKWEDGIKKYIKGLQEKIDNL